MNLPSRTPSSPLDSPSTPAGAALGRRQILRGTAAGVVLAAPLLGGPLLGAPAASASAAGRAPSAPAFVRTGRPVLTHGVASGDVTTRSAMLWSRADRPARLVAEISGDPAFRHAVRIPGPLLTASSDFTGSLPLHRLPAGEELFYRLRAVDPHDPRRSGPWESGRLVTAPERRRDVRFLWSGDVAGQGWGVNPDLGGFRIADAMRARRADFYLSSGDNVYADGVVTGSVALPDGRIWRNLVTEEKSKVAETLAEFHGNYRYNLLADNWRAFLAETSVIAQWDDHEVTNNWYPGEILDDDRYTERRVDVLAARARRAFHDYMPVSAVSPDPDGRVYRVLHLGPSLDLFVLDMRTHKDPNTSSMETRADGGVLGERQTAWLLRELARSRATWKVIAADLPIGLVVRDGETAQEGLANGDPGSPRGREIDLARVLSGLQRMGIRNHVWLTADVHYTAAHHYSPDRAAYQRFDPFWEFVAGPLNAGSFPHGDLDATFGPSREFVSSPQAANTSPLEGHQYFGEVEVDGRTESLTVTLRDVVGAALYTRTLEPAAR
ncbi:alkaline phosphatase D family protein [Nocardioides insulae]|uniref:alkaline phosphatase D family protein n=1 Tax=Nocardioides insulae TaxID=394734 RepID=UPI00040C603F|nr:alkaline phosphatase D family protein [Nocardioides insulae]